MHRAALNGRMGRLQAAAAAGRQHPRSHQGGLHGAGLAASDNHLGVIGAAAAAGGQHAHEVSRSACRAGRAAGHAPCYAVAAGCTPNWCQAAAATLLLVWVGARLHHLNCTCPACNNCANRDQQGATAFERCIRDAARSLLQEKEAALQEAGHSRPQPRSRPSKVRPCQPAAAGTRLWQQSLASCIPVSPSQTAPCH